MVKQKVHSPKLLSQKKKKNATWQETLLLYQNLRLYTQDQCFENSYFFRGFFFFCCIVAPEVGMKDKRRLK